MKLPAVAHKVNAVDTKMISLAAQVEQYTRVGDLQRMFYVICILR